jgi:hypothetical protein
VSYPPVKGRLLSLDGATLASVIGKKSFPFSPLQTVDDGPEGRLLRYSNTPGLGNGEKDRSRRKPFGISR